MINKILIFLILAAVLMFTGCINESNISTSTTPAPTPKIFVSGPSDPTLFNIGESTSDGLTRFTLNSVRYTSYNNSRYLITDITVENISPNRSRSYGIIWHFKVFDSEGYTYNPGFSDETIISKPFSGADMFPGDKRRGEIAFKVPDSVKGLKFRFMWDPLNNKDGVTFKLID